MPKCLICKNLVAPDQLKPVGENTRGWPEEVLGCPDCRKKRFIYMIKKYPYKETEVTMNKEAKPIFSLNVLEVGSNGDYRVVATVRTGGISFKFDRTIDDIRNFFTKRRERTRRGRKSDSLKTVDP